MKRFEYKATVIVPVYNAEAYLAECLDSLIHQTMDPEEFEVLLIDDGSTDGSPSIERKYAENCSNIKVRTAEHQGVSKARNLGISIAKGKYLFFLDSDDKISPETIASVTDFFAKHEDQVDLVTYYLDYLQPDGTFRRRHYRYQIMKETGVYDLTEGKNIYISQSTMNVCVKNREVPIYFDETLRTSEDQKFNLQNLQEKMRIGFCAEGQYIYRQHSTNGAASLSNFACYAFEGETKFWEDIFAAYGGAVPRYVQALYLYQIDWKIRWDKLLPYHYKDDQLRKAKARIAALLNQVDSEVIMNKPEMQLSQKVYLVSQKTNRDVTYRFSPDEVAMMEGNTLLTTEKVINLQIIRMKREGKQLQILGIMDTPLFFEEKPEIYLVENDGRELQGVVFPSAYGREENISSAFSFWGFRFNTPIEDFRNFYFAVAWRGIRFRTKCSLGGFNQFFSDILSRYEYYDASYHYLYQPYNNRFYIQGSDEKQRKRWLKSRDIYYSANRWTTLTRKLAHGKLPGLQRVWLYLDCRDEHSDNGWYQFAHDFEKRDGVSRYYVLNATDYDKALAEIPSKYRKHIVRFGGRSHKILFLRAEMVLFSYFSVEDVNPFETLAYETYREAGRMLMYVYLQHGVLHAHLPDMYAAERTWIDREVVSTHFEIQNLTKQYHYEESQLIPCGMPRYDLMNCEEKPKKRILYAPSWRMYLVNRVPEGNLPMPEVFSRSDFYRESQKLLASPELAELLEKYDYELDVRLHRIFQCYQDNYHVSSERIHMNAEKRNEADYSIFLTDFSSYEFDFAYLQRAILHFFPDEELFRAGLNHYRKLDLPEEQALGENTHTAEETISALQRLMERGGMPEPIYRDRMAEMFIHRDRNHRERLYQALISTSEQGK